MRVLNVVGASLVAVGCFVFAPGESRLAQVADEDAAAIYAGTSYPVGTCSFSLTSTNETFCSTGCFSDWDVNSDGDYWKYETTMPCTPESGCGYKPIAEETEYCNS